MSSKTLWKNDPASLPACAVPKGESGADDSSSPLPLHPALSTPPAPIALEPDQHRWVSPVGWKPGDPDLARATPEAEQSEGGSLGLPATGFRKIVKQVRSAVVRWMKLLMGGRS